MRNIQEAYSHTPFSLHGKVALVTGGRGLLGREFCIALANAGATVYSADINAGEPTEGEKALGIRCKVMNVTDQESIEHCVGEIIKEADRIDILVNSAAIDPKTDEDVERKGFDRFTSYPIECWQQSIDVNLTGLFMVTRSVCREMERFGVGSIINIGSNYGLVGPDQRIYRRKGEEVQEYYKPSVYSVCKAGIIGFTRYLAAYYAGTKIRANVLTPAGVLNKQDDDFVQAYAERTVLRRMSRKEEYHGAIVFLASEASSYMTGANLVIDGGWTTL